MRKALLLAAIFATTVYGQAGRDLYKVDFTIRDSGDAGGKSGRKYSLLVNASQKGTFRVGNRVPVGTGSSSTGISNTQFTYVDVGVNIDCIVQETNGQMAMHADLELSTAVPNEKSAGAGANPTISQIRLNIDTALKPGKPTIVASFDDPVTARKFEIEANIVKAN